MAPQWSDIARMPRPQPREPVTVFRGTAGINNKADPARLKFDPQTGIADLAEGVNVDVDDTGRPKRRLGYALTAETGYMHSIFCDGGLCLGVSGSSLYWIGNDYSKTLIRSNLTLNARMGYVQVGDNIYYGNGYEKGIVLSTGVHRDWTAATYSGPTTIKTMSDPPIGYLFALMGGWIYIAHQDEAGNYLMWFTEPFAYSWVDYARDAYWWESRITMMRPIADGMYASDSKATYFLAGRDPKKLERIKVADYPAVMGTDLNVPGHRVAGGQLLQGEIAIWTSHQGICIGGVGGQFFNLTDEKLALPEAVEGSAIFTDDGRYIVTFEP